VPARPTDVECVAKGDNEEGDNEKGDNEEGDNEEGDIEGARCLPRCLPRCLRRRSDMRMRVRGCGRFLAPALPMIRNSRRCLASAASAPSRLFISDVSRFLASVARVCARRVLPVSPPSCTR
jgi:hypothetical protein